LNAVSSAWAQVDSAARGPGVLLVLDFERNGHYPGGTMRVDQAGAFVERIRERTGIYPGIYGSEYYLRQALNSPKVTNAQKSVLAETRLGAFGRKSSSRNRPNCRSRLGRGVSRHALGLLRRSRSFFLNPAPRCEINCKTAEPMSAFVMCACDRCEPGAPMRV